MTRTYLLNASAVRTFCIVKGSCLKIPVEEALVSLRLQFLQRLNGSRLRFPSGHLGFMGEDCSRKEHKERLRLRQKLVSVVGHRLSLPLLVTYILFKICRELGIYITHFVFHHPSIKVRRRVHRTYIGFFVGITSCVYSFGN